ncbi:heterokaryon incompatibility protein-domain-containing protein [Exophiala viscosa]|uniref:heterokaryon incompatibility protein-domain-containing protein n=1 Tax=Exophiala viscosa TaxID=2486360 RepID=UPI00219A4DDC|nr:heterokaryon incompatibility protein-domain-containing protein [Exophiala viscosa]
MHLVEIQAGGTPCLKTNVTEDTEDVPPYAILSHTWALNNAEEFTFQDAKSGSVDKPGYVKIKFCQKQAIKDGLRYIWVDTCCIDKTNQVEVSEAIISMFRWYQEAKKCYVYLSDVSFSGNGTEQDKIQCESDFRRSRWFTRGWTLQELLAPRTVDFFSREGRYLGNKTTLSQQIHEITGLPLRALHGTHLATFSVEERMRWAARRQTKRKEDQAYCLLGIFNVFLPPLYGEGDNAFNRLRKEINEHLRVRTQVETFYSEALKAGGTDNGAPGVRSMCHPNYYGACVISPAGHNIEAVAHSAAT